METYLIIAAILVVVAGKIIYDQKSLKERLQNKITKAWGNIPTHEYTAERFDSIQFYYNTIRDQKMDVDDITWNDIDMDDIFMLLNNTCSSIGEEYLYSILRKLKFNNEDLQERSRLIQLFLENPDLRFELQMELSQIGRVRNISTFEYMNLLEKLEERSVAGDRFCGIGLILSIASIALNPALGVLLTVGMVVYTISTYYATQKKFDNFIEIVTYINRLLSFSKKFKKLEITELSDYATRLENIEKEFRDFTRGSFILKSKNPIGSSLTDIFLDYYRMIFHADIIKFYKVLKIYKGKKDKLIEMFEIIGLLDSMIAVASFRTMIEDYCEPKLSVDPKPWLKIKDVYHPMIHEPVLNSIEENQCVLITGSNASGKSTFIKTLAINAILSQTIYTALCKSYEASFFKVASSMALKDSIFSKESYYIVEIKSLKRILDQLDENIPTLCFVDEVLRGTNTLERIAASSEILYGLAKANALCFAATHDIELTHILEEYYSNYHFQEQFVDNNIVFDYKLYDGRAISKNAIKLLGVMGYTEDIIQRATDAANHFLESGEWEKI